MKAWAACIIAVALFAGSARAEDLSVARDHYRKGTTAYDLQDYRTAAHEYEEAFRIVNDPALLFNIGQAYRYAGDATKAIGAYRAFLRRVPKADNRAEVEARITDLQQLVDAQKSSNEKPPVGTMPPGAEKVPPVPETLPPPQAPTPAQAQPPAPLVPTAPVEPDAARLKRRNLRIGGLVVGAVGLGALGAGIGFLVLSRSAADDLNHPKPGTVFSSSLERTFHTDVAVESALLAVGAAALVSGVVLYIVGARHPHRAVDVMLLPVIAPDRASASLHLSF
jgi:tetratricopeptide (TPR) repeat protein